MTLKLKQTSLLTIFFFFFSWNLIIAQSNYALAWAELDNANVPESISYFQKAIKDEHNKAEALLCLASKILENNCGGSCRAICGF